MNGSFLSMHSNIMVGQKFTDAPRLKTGFCSDEQVVSEMPYTSLTEHNTGTTQKVPSVVNSTTELKNITTTSNNTCTHVSRYIAHWMALSLEAVVIFVSAIVVLTPNGKF
jgi:hypothetical protein